MAGILGTGCSAQSTSGSARNRAPIALLITATGCQAIPTEGSGVALGGRLVATVAHVVAGATEISAVTSDGHDHRARVVAIDTSQDVAVLVVDDLAEPPTRMTQLAPGERGSYVGFHAGRAAPVSFAVTRAASILAEDIYVRGSSARPGYVLAAPVRHGDSGAGLVREDGTLGGLVWAASRNDNAQGWGVGIEALTPLIAAAHSAPDANPTVPCA